MEQPTLAQALRVAAHFRGSWAEAVKAAQADAAPDPSDQALKELGGPVATRRMSADYKEFRAEARAKFGDDQADMIALKIVGKLHQAGHYT